MGELYNELKKHKIKLCVWGAVFIIVIPALINLAFKAHSFGLLEAEWGAGDVLSFYSNVFVGTATIFLGWVVLRQTERLNEEQKIENNKTIVKYLNDSEIEFRNDLMYISLTCSDFDILQIKIRIYINGESICDQKCNYNNMGGEDNIHKLVLQELKCDREVLNKEFHSNKDTFIDVLANIKATKNGVCTKNFITLKGKLCFSSDGRVATSKPYIHNSISEKPILSK